MIGRRAISLCHRTASSGLSQQTGKRVRPPGVSCAHRGRASRRDGPCDPPPPGCAHSAPKSSGHLSSQKLIASGACQSTHALCPKPDPEPRLPGDIARNLARADPGPLLPHICSRESPSPESFAHRRAHRPSVPSSASVLRSAPSRHRSSSVSLYASCSASQTLSSFLQSTSWDRHRLPRGTPLACPPARIPVLTWKNFAIGHLIQNVERHRSRLSHGGMLIMLRVYRLRAQPTSPDEIDPKSSASARVAATSDQRSESFAFPCARLARTALRPYHYRPSERVPLATNGPHAGSPA
ncbi:hypothetical protein Corgl_0392 [Coriobacterium glomerans PW2]|uniref:Uncharacterized protein n=1 Tax=Coriobacterium glomerans (strain ATCC 49209 / DSM 20642 / JCM 10262 / PW2) TaxID=700015 RepID=F2NAI3_CORGP|nr:hypothetical protein Corgl_0392 [Coriobacterium glomerans PW2]